MGVTDINDPNYNTPVLHVSMTEKDLEALVDISERYLEHPLQISKNAYGYKAYAHKKEKGHSLFTAGREWGKYLSKTKV